MKQVQKILSDEKIRELMTAFSVLQKEDDPDLCLQMFRRCFAYWELTDDDLDRAMRMAVKYHRTRLPAMRKIMGIYLTEWAAPFSEGYDCRIYYNVPGTITYMYFLRGQLVQAGRKTYAGSPDFISMAVLYGIFGKKARIDTGSCRHCAVNLMRAALAKDTAFPPADVRFTFGFTCDEAPMQDALFESAETDTLRVQIASPMRGDDTPGYIEESLRDAFCTVKSRYGAVKPEREEDYRTGTVSEQEAECYRQCKSARFRLAVRVHQVLDEVRKSRRFLVTNNDIVLLESLLITSFQCGMQYLEKILTELLKEMRTIQPEAARKVQYCFCVYYTPVCNPAYGAVMEENGIALLDHTAFSNSALYTGCKDPYEDASREAMGMLIAGPARKEGEKIADLILRKDLDGFVSGMFAFDRWMGMQQHQLQSIIEEKTGRTVFFYDTDFWGQESFSRDRMETAVETLRYMLEVSR